MEEDLGGRAYWSSVVSIKVIQKDRKYKKVMIQEMEAKKEIEMESRDLTDGWCGDG